MMKHLRFSLVALFALVCNATIAQEVTLDFTTNTWGLPESKANIAKEAQSFTSGDYTITLEAASVGYYFNTDGYLMLGKADATLTLPAFNFEVGQIVVTGRDGASGSTLQNIFVGETAVSTETKGATGVNTYEIAEGSQAAGTVYVLKVLSKHNSQVTKIEVYKKGTSAPEEKPEEPTTSYENTPETAYTVAKAMELAVGDGKGSTVYIKGIITEIKEVSASYGNASYYINDVADSKDGQIQVYRGKYLDGEKFTSEDQIGLGDEVIIYGELSEYNGTPQIAQGSKIHSIKKAAVDPDAVDISNTPETAYTIAKAKELVAAGKGLEKSVYVKGFITDIQEISTQYGNATYSINDEKDVTDGQLLVYRGKYFYEQKFTEESQIKVGDEIIVYGKLTTYNDTPQIGTGSTIYSINGDTATGINGIEVEKNAPKGIYTIAGQKVNTITKGGIYIIDGKKTFVK